MRKWDNFMATVAFNNNTVPVAVIGTERFFANESTCSVIDFATDIDLMIKRELRCFQKYESLLFIPGVWPDFSAPIILPSIFGSRILWFEDAPAAVERPPITDIRKFIDEPIPEIGRSGIIPFYIQALKKFMLHSAAVENMNFSWSIGPGELAGYLIGHNTMFTILMDDPGLLQSVFFKCTSVIIDFLRLQHKIVPSFKGIFITDDISGLISREHYETLLLPYHQKVRQEFADKIIVFHNDTSSNHIIDSIGETGFDVFNFGPTTNLELLIDKLLSRKKMALMGNLDPTGILMQHNTDIIQDKIDELIKVGKEHPGFIIGTGGGLNATPEQCMLLLNNIALSQRLGIM